MVTANRAGAAGGADMTARPVAPGFPARCGYRRILEMTECLSTSDATTTCAKLVKAATGLRGAVGRQRIGEVDIVDEDGNRGSCSQVLYRIADRVDRSASSILLAQDNARFIPPRDTG